MQGVWFNDKHSFQDFKLITNKITVGYPEVKTSYVSIPGGDGVLDLTEALGGVKYGSRYLSFQFTLRAQDEWENAKERIGAFLHGRHLSIRLDKDKEYYYSGRCQVNDFFSEKRLEILTVEAKCDPYKYHIKETIHKAKINGSSQLLLNNDRKMVVPEIEVSGNVKLTFQGVSYALSEGFHKILDIELLEGYNRLAASGNGVITFRYREGAI